MLRLLLWGSHLENQFGALSLQAITLQLSPYLSSFYGFLLSAEQSPDCLERPVGLLWSGLELLPLQTPSSHLAQRSAPGS